jgi:hypothetical protein
MEKHSSAMDLHELRGPLVCISGARRWEISSAGRYGFLEPREQSETFSGGRIIEWPEKEAYHLRFNSRDRKFRTSRLRPTRLAPDETVSPERGRRRKRRR